MAQRTNGRRTRRRAKFFRKAKAAGAKLAPVARRVYEAGGRDALEVGLSFIPGVGPVLGKGVSKALDVGLTIADKAAQGASKGGARKGGKKRRKARMGGAKKPPKGQDQVQVDADLEVAGEPVQEGMGNGAKVAAGVGLLALLALLASKGKRKR